jgi:hypothetical protein
MADNPIEHSRTKHIDIRYHFLRDHQQRGDIEIAYVNTKDQLADIFTKPLDEKTFSELRNELNLYYSLRTECRRPQESVLPPRVRAPDLAPRIRAPTPPPPLPLVAPPDPDPCPSPTHRSRPCANGGGGRVILGGGPFAGTGGTRRGVVDGAAGTGPVAPGRSAEGGGLLPRTAEATVTAVTRPLCACLLLHSTASRNPRQAGAPPPPKQSVAASSLCSPTAPAPLRRRRHRHFRLPPLFPHLLDGVVAAKEVRGCGADRPRTSNGAMDAEVVEQIDRVPTAPPTSYPTRSSARGDDFPFNVARLLLLL